MKVRLVEPAFVFEDETYLTVSKTSLFFAGDGFSVYDRNAQLVFRVDSYGPDPQDRTELVLMDATGRCLLTVRRKRPSLHHRWEGYVGERKEGQKPIFSVRRSSIIGRSSVTVEVFTEPTDEYHIEGSFAQRCCKIYNADKQPVAEIYRKVDVSTNVVLAKDVFSLVLKPGFDAAFAMGLVLVPGPALSRNLKETTAIARIGQDYIHLASDQRTVLLKGFVLNDRYLKFFFIDMDIVSVGVGSSVICLEFLKAAFIVNQAVFRGVAHPGRVYVVVSVLIAERPRFKSRTGPPKSLGRPWLVLDQINGDGFVEEEEEEEEDMDLTAEEQCI